MMDVNLGVVSTDLSGGSALGSSLGTGAAKAHGRQSAQVSIFQTIPPERVGLQGEYDHQGLAKRVWMTFQQHCSGEQIGHLRISQRGAVIVIVGVIPNQRLLIRLVNLAMATPGAGDVEINGVSVGYGLKHYLEIKPSQKALSQFLPLLAP
jgi:hypothetical protein